MSDRTFRTASKDLAGRCCRYCLKGIKKGDRYRVGGYTARRRVIYEHLWCVGRHREEPQAKTAAKPTLQRAYKRQTMEMREADGSVRVGSASNFPGMVVEWKWEADELPAYRLHVGMLAASRLSIERRCDEMVHGSLDMLLSRVAGGMVDADRLAQEAREAEGEFGLPPGFLGGYLALIGYSVLQAERVSEKQVLRMNTVTESFIAHVLEGEADET